MFKCPWCDQQFASESSVVRHSGRIHKHGRRDYDVLMKYNGIIPTCECGCGEEVSWHKLTKSFRRFIRGHANRVPEIRAQMIAAGTAAAHDPEKRQKNSEALKRYWDNAGDEKKKERGEMFTAARRAAGVYESEHFRKAVSDAAKERWQVKGDQYRETMRSQEFRDKVSVATKAALDNDESREMLSIRASRNQALGIIAPNRTKRSWMFNPFTGVDEHLDSGWERIVLEEAIRRNIPITRNKTIFIPYDDFEGKHHRYVPDFVTLSSKTVIEVKGMMTPIDAVKFSFAQVHCSNLGASFVVLDSTNACVSDSTWFSIV